MKSNSSLTLACLGDLMIGGRALDALRRMGAESVASVIWSPLEGADVVLANLEVPITDSYHVRENKHYNFKTTSEILSLFDGRFVLGLANNHMLDYGERGLLDTIEALDAQNVPHAGAGRNLDEARRPAIIDVAGVNLGVICAADPRFQAATRTSPGTFPAQPDLLRGSIRAVRQSAEVIVVSIHAGTEFLSVPSPAQLRLAELCLEEGARVVSFHHAHCVGGVMRDERGVVLFGTGNYVFPLENYAGYIFRWESAAWRITLTGHRQGMAHVEVQPVFPDEEGLPVKATGTKSRRIISRIKRYSRRIDRRRHLGWWRLVEMMKFKYLWMNMVNYALIAYHQGIWSMVQTLARGIRTQLR